MDSKTFRELLTPIGQDAIHAAMDLEPREKNFLAYFQRLCKRYPREIARGALETAILRAEARSKFPQAEKMYFTREALEQASSYEVASQRAERYHSFEQIADLGCSIGGDMLALVEAAPTIGIDRDPLRLAIAKSEYMRFGIERSLRPKRPGKLVSVFTPLLLNRLILRSGPALGRPAHYLG